MVVMKMNPAKLDQRITFLNPPGGVSDSGFISDEWTEHKTIWAALKTLKGRSFYAAANTNLENNRMFEIRYREDINDRMRIRWRGVDHDIISLEDDNGQKRTMTIYCKAVNADES